MGKFTRPSRLKPRPLSPNEIDLEKRIAVIEATIERIESLPPALGVNWQKGMLEYYRRILSELEGYRHAFIRSNSRPE